MRFGIFYEHQIPRPWGDDGEHRLIQDALEQIELADRVGLHSAWEVEHHFLEEYSHSSASGVFLGAASQRTQRIRLGLGILPLPPGFMHPARVAETPRCSTSSPAAGSSWAPARRRAAPSSRASGWTARPSARSGRRCSRVVARMMVEEPFAGTEGAYLSMPPRNVVPKPIQKPHPPLWVACSRRETIRLAAEKGIGALSFSFVEPEEAQGVGRRVPRDRGQRALRARRLRGQPPGGRASLPMMCAPDEAQAIERGIDGAHFFGYSLAHYYVFGDHRPGRTNVYEEFLARRDDVGFARSIITADAAPLGVRVLQQGLGSLRGAIGSPEQVGRPVPALRGGRGRPADLRDAGGAQSPRAHLRVDRALRRRGPARVRRARRRGRRRARRALRPRDRRRAGPPRAAARLRSGLHDRRRPPPGRRRGRRVASTRRPMAERGGPGSRRCSRRRASAPSGPSCGAPTTAAWSAPPARRAG